MAILESVFIALGVGVAKYLAKEVLPEDWLDQIAAELIALGAKELSGLKAAEPVAAVIGKRLDLLYRHSPLPENEKTATLIEVIHTLNRADTSTPRLIELDLNAGALQRGIDRTAAGSDAVAFG